MTLTRTLVATYFKASSRAMFGAPALHSSTPHTPRTGLHLMAHQRYSFGFRYAELVFNGIERCTILPSHFHDAINLSLGKILRYFGTFHLPGVFQCLCTKNLIYPKKFAPRAEDPSHGAKNGKRTGKMSNIAAPGSKRLKTPILGTSRRHPSSACPPARRLTRRESERLRFRRNLPTPQ